MAFKNSMPRVLRGVLFLSVMLAALATPSLAQSVDYERIDLRAKQLVQRDDMMGLAIGVVENGEIRFTKGYGRTHIGGTPVNENTVFRWASLSKGLAGTIIGQLADKGELALTDTVGSFETSLRLPGSGQNRATLIDVLSHRLGVVSNAYDGRLEDGRTPTSIRRALSGLKNVCALGACHTYQNVAFDVASEIVADVTEVSYAATAKKLVFDPLGMTTASMTRKDLTASGNYAQPYRKRRRDPSIRRTDLNDSYYRVPAAGGVNSSIKDLAKYMQAQMGLFPDVLPEPVLAELQTPRIGTIRELRGMKRRYPGRMTSSKYGLGWRIYDYAGHRVIGHRGAVRGYRALILFDPEKDTGVVALWNSNASKPVGIQFEVMDMVYGLPRKDWLSLDPPPTPAGSAPTAQ